MQDLAEQYHPNWRKLTQKARLLIARNGAQVLGPDLGSPVSLVVCWTEGGLLTAGTAQALRIANDRKWQIPVVNLGDPNARQLNVDTVLKLTRSIDDGKTDI
jgi:hypothetical protein